MKKYLLIATLLYLSLISFGQNTPGMPAGNIGIGLNSTKNLLQVFNANSPANTLESISEIANFSGSASGNISQFKFLMRRHTLNGDWVNISSKLQFVTDVTNQGYLEFNPKNAAGGMLLGSGGKEIMHLLESGKVGIGTSTPGGLFQVSDGGGDATKYGSVQIVRSSNPMDNNFHISLIRAANSVAGIGFTNDNTNTFGIWQANNNSGVPLMSFNTDQTVSINTAAVKGYAFAVNGAAIFTKAVVKLKANWPDYVFAPSYKLPSLNDVERYINNHHHLADIPTSSEVERNGIDIGDNQVKLLKKVEELTLYMIDLNKKMEKLLMENEILKKKINGISL